MATIAVPAAAVREPSQPKLLFSTERGLKVNAMQRRTSRLVEFLITHNRINVLYRQHATLKMNEILNPITLSYPELP